MRYFLTILTLCLFGGTPQGHASSASVDPTGDPPNDHIKKVLTMLENKKIHEAQDHAQEPDTPVSTSTSTADSAPHLLRGGEKDSTTTAAEEMALRIRVEEDLLGGKEIHELSLQESADTLKQIGVNIESYLAKIENIDVGNFAELEMAKSMGGKAAKKAIKHFKDAARFVQKTKQSEGSLVLHEKLQGKNRRRRAEESIFDHKEEGEKSSQDSHWEQLNHQQHFDPFNSGSKAGGGFSTFADRMPKGFSPLKDMINSLLNGDLIGAYKGAKGSKYGHHIGHGSRRLHGRSLATKTEQCDLLQECAGAMSASDIFIFMYGDDLDPATGEIDPNIIRFDEADFFTKRNTIQSILNDLRNNIGDYNEKCDELLQQFHRSTEVNGAPQWRGAMVNEVCHAEGSTVKVKLSEIGRTIIGGLTQGDHVGCHVRPTLGWSSGDTAEWEDEFMPRADCLDTCSPDFLYAGYFAFDSSGQVQCWCRNELPNDTSSMCSAAGGDFDFYETLPGLFRQGCYPSDGGSPWPSADIDTWEDDVMTLIECVDTCSPDFLYAGFFGNIDEHGSGLCWCRDDPPIAGACPDTTGVDFDVYPTTSKLYQLMYDWHKDAIQTELDLIINGIVAEPFFCAEEISRVGGFGASDGDVFAMCVGDTCTEPDGVDDPQNTNRFTCCRDTEPTSGFAVWEQVNGCSVWTTAERGTGFCLDSPTTYSNAVSLCNGSGGRICTTSEVQQGCAQQTRCPATDPERIWTTYDGGINPAFIYHEGDAGVYAICGSGDSTRCSESEGLAGPDEMHGVRCCSEERPGSFAHAIRAGCTVFAESFCDSTGALYSLEVARDICATNGGRLCTPEEVQNECAKNSGCGYDDYLVWAERGFETYRMPIGIDPGSCGSSQARDCHGQLQQNGLDNGLLFKSVAGILVEVDNHACEAQFSEVWDDCVSEGSSQLPTPFAGFTSECLFPRYLEAFADCYSEAFTQFDTGLELVFGRDVTPGEICGIRNAVVDEGKLLPGSCCLDAPYQLDGELWGSQYDCSQPCQHPGPLFAGISEEGCNIYGGTWCPSPTDCTILQECIADMNATAIAEDLLSFQAYLSLAPTIIDPTNQNQCGPARAYFGFDEYFVNDGQICDDVYQLRLSRTFDWLETFFMQGDQDAPDETPGEIGNTAVEVPDVEAAEPDLTEATILMVELPQGTIMDSDRALSTTSEVQMGVQWATTNHALSQTAYAAEIAFDLAQALDCGGSFLATICAGIKNTLVGLLFVTMVSTSIAFAISDFQFGQCAEWSNVQQIQLFENSEIIKANMQSNAEWMRDSFNTLVANQQSMFDTNKMNLETSIALLATLEGQNALGDTVEVLSEDLASFSAQETILEEVRAIQSNVDELLVDAGLRQGRRALLSDGKEPSGETVQTNDVDRIALIVEGILEEVKKTKDENAAALDKVKKNMETEVKGAVNEALNEIKAELQGHIEGMMIEMRLLLEENIERP